MTEAPTPIITAGRDLVHTAAGRGLQTRLVGGVGIWLHGHDEARRALGREYADLDLVAHARDSRRLRDVLEALGLEPNKLFNSIHGERRLMFYAHNPDYNIDIFLDVFEMSHKLDLGARLEKEPVTLPAAELLLTKLQVAQLNRKDATDIALLLWSNEPKDTDGPLSLNLPAMARLCADDWGLFTTVTDNLAAIDKMVGGFEIPDTARALIHDRIQTVTRALGDQPKSTRWKLRDRVGRRVRWYELPEEVVR